MRAHGGQVQTAEAPTSLRRMCIRPRGRPGRRCKGGDRPHLHEGGEGSRLLRLPRMRPAMGSGEEREVGEGFELASDEWGGEMGDEMEE